MAKERISRRSVLMAGTTGIIAAGTGGLVASTLGQQPPPQPQLPPAHNPVITNDSEQTVIDAEAILNGLIDGQDPTLTQITNIYASIQTLYTDAWAAHAIEDEAADSYFIEDRWDEIWADDNNPPAFGVETYTPLTWSDFVDEEMDVLSEMPSNTALATMFPNAPEMIEDLGTALAKILTALGVPVASLQGFIEAIEEFAKDLWEGIWRNLKNKNWRIARRYLMQLLEKLFSKRFKDLLIQKIGKQAAAKILGQIAARFVPILGWIIIVASLVWAVGKQYYELFTTAEVAPA